jgi:hypothetical protein
MNTMDKAIAIKESYGIIIFKTEGSEKKSQYISIMKNPYLFGQIRII